MSTNLEPVDHRWPLVDPKDDGIRPAGRPNECFYCNRKVGQRHGPECVIVTKVVKIRITLEYPVTVPHFWDESQINFHRNESSWCADNAIREIEAHAEKSGCLCGELKTEFVTVVDDTPTRELREPS